MKTQAELKLQWEIQTTNEMAELLECTYSDASGVLETKYNAWALERAWKADMSPKEAVEYVLKCEETGMIK